MKYLWKATLLVALFFSCSASYAGDWKFGAQYAHATGVSDVVDQYKENLRAEGFIVVSDIEPSPVAIGFKSRYETQSGFQVGIDAGPLFLILGDTSHYEIPIVATVGFSFFQKSTLSPFLRVGASYHIAKGDYVNSSTPGLFASIGTDIGKTWGIEVAVDQSTVELDVLSTGEPVDFNTYDMIISVFALF